MSEAVRLRLYADRECIKRLKSLQLGKLDACETKTFEFFIRNEGPFITEDFHIEIKTSEFHPAKIQLVSPQHLKRLLRTVLFDWRPSNLAG